MESPEPYTADLSAFLKTELLAAGTSFDENSELSEIGVDSFALMEVILFVERRFGVVMPMDKLTPESTRTLRGLATCVAGLHNEGAHA